MKQVYVDHEGRVIVIRYSGIVDNADAQIGVPEFRQLAGYSFLVDLREVVTFDVSTESIQVAAARSGPGQGSRCAFVAAGQLAFGLTRMFELYAGSDRFSVFRTVEAACDWLRISSAVADAALEVLAERLSGDDS
jgi:hypothetical protein